MPKVTTPVQRVRTANAQKSAATQVRAANFQPQSATSRATTGTYVGPRPANTLTSAKPTATSACNCSACTSLQCLERTRFFAGQLLTDTDLTNEQNYVLAKNRLHNRYLHGWGVVCGLQVTCSECDGWVTVNPGYAIDPCGNDIIVCAAQSFNVLDAIQACSGPSSTTTDCSPLRYRPTVDCTDVIQKWCITVQYQEQAAQMVTPLKQSGSSSSGCGCGCSGSSTGTTSGCGCGCSGTSKKSSGCGCGSKSSATSTSSTSTTTACEPTRIIEGFQFGVCALPTDSTNAQPGTLAYQAENCLKTIVQLAEQAPDLDQNANGTPQDWYQSVTNYLYTVRQYFAQNSVLTNCKVLKALGNIVVPQPTPNAALSDYADVEGEIELILFAAIFECVCLSLLPQCPPNPCDTRVPLACVSVQNGAVVSICHFECRKQLIGFPTLQYWLEPIFASFGKLITNFLEKFCCPSANSRDKSPYLNMLQAFSSDNVTTYGFTNASMFNRTVNSYVAQKMGASLVNGVNPSLNAIDTRPYVGQPLQSFQAFLVSKGSAVQSTDGLRNTDTGVAINDPYQSTQLDVQYIDNDPSWDLAAITASAQLAPSAISAGQPLTVYVSGKDQSIVGIEATSPTRALQVQINTLTQQVTNLQTQLAAPQVKAVQAKASAKASNKASKSK